MDAENMAKLLDLGEVIIHYTGIAVITWIIVKPIVEYIKRN